MCMSMYEAVLAISIASFTAISIITKVFSEGTQINYMSGPMISSSTVYKKSFEDTKGVIRSRKSKKDRQYNGQKTEDKERYFLYIFHIKPLIFITFS